MATVALFRVVFSCVLISLYVCFANHAAHTPSSPYVNTRFATTADVNKTADAVVVTSESATTPSADAYASSTSWKLVPDRDIPVIVWWTKWLNLHDKPTEITCGDNTCYSTRNRTWLQSPHTRAVFMYGSDLDPDDLPLPREPYHEWALLHEESPQNNYMLVHPQFIRLINHTSTFRRESDFPLSTQNIRSLSYLINRKPIALSIKNSLMKRNDLAPVLYVQSHCDVPSDRDRYVLELMKYINVDSYGACINNKQLPKHLQNPVESMESTPFLDFIAPYKFHIAFENAICEDYMTEKLFRPLHVGSIPIYMGSPKASDWMPNTHSVIMAKDYQSPKELAEFIKKINANDDLYEHYLSYKTEPIQNTFLLEHMNTRPWGKEDTFVQNNDFISGFECYVCNSISDNYNNRLTVGRTRSRTSKMASRNHLHCPQPYPSVGDVNELPPNDSWNRMSWIDDYWTGFDKATAIRQMVEAREKDPATFHNYFMNVMLRPGRI